MALFANLTVTLTEDLARHMSDMLLARMAAAVADAVAISREAESAKSELPTSAHAEIDDVVLNDIAEYRAAYIEAASVREMMMHGHTETSAKAWDQALASALRDARIPEVEEWGAI